MPKVSSLNAVEAQISRGQIKINVNTILLLKTMLASPSCIDLIHIITNWYLETNVLCLQNLIKIKVRALRQRMCTKINSGCICKKCHFP